LRQCLHARWHVKGFRLPGVLVAPTAMKVLPGHRRRLREEGRAVLVALVSLVGDQVGQDRGMIINDAVGHQPATFLPQLLFIFCLEAELAEVGIRDRTAELVVILATVQGPLRVPA
jgi:hypothetical protein